MLLHIFRLIRLPNLLIIALTQYFMRWFIIEPILNRHSILSVNSITGKEETLTFDLKLQISEFEFLFLVLATVFIAAAGYVINDYFDRKADLLNRPDKVIVGKHIKRRSAMALHVVLNILGVICGITVAFFIKLPKLAFVFVLVAGILWFYSTTYKKQFLIGNLIVAVFAALVPFLVYVFEIAEFYRIYRPTILNYNLQFGYIWIWAGGFAFFAFITTLAREIIKDMEDFEGDCAYGRDTLPIVLGTFYSKLIVALLLVTTIIGLTVSYFYFVRDNTTLWYFIIALILPLVFIIYRIITANEKRHYATASLVTKIVMLTGITYAAVVNFIILG